MGQAEGLPLLVVAGESSGDSHAAQAMRELWALRPELRPFGLGGGELRSVGVQTVADSGEISVVGIAEALRVLPRAWRIYRRLLREVEARGCRYAVLVDFPDFNLRLAKALSRRGIRVLYYISPQVWAWRRGRVETIRRTVERILVLFPFEVDFYHRHGVDATFVGHPLVDRVPQLPQAWEHDAAPQAFRLALLPGSRRSEVRALLPGMLRAVRQIGESLPVAPRLIAAPSIPVDWLRAQLETMREEVPLVRDDRHAAVADAHLALVASGTATLECGLLTTPMIVVYRLAGLSWWLARRLVRLPHVSLVNLVLEEEVVPELLQRQASPAGIAQQAAELLCRPGRIAQMRERLQELRPRLGEEGGSRRAAEAMAEWLEVRSA